MTSILERPEAYESGPDGAFPGLSPETAVDPYVTLDELLTDPEQPEPDDRPTQEIDVIPPPSTTVYEHDEAIAKYLLFRDEHQQLLDRKTGIARAGELGVRAVKAVAVAGQVAVAVTVLSPANELIRGGVVAAGYLVSHSPAMGALTTGGSTLALETAGGLAAASVMATRASQRFFKFLNSKLKKVADQELSTVAKATTVLGLGTVVGMAIEQAEDPDRTVAQNRWYAVKTSAALGGVLAAAGAAGTETLNKAIENPEISLPLAAGVVALESLRRVWRGMRYPKPVKDPETEMWYDTDKYAQYHLVTDEAEFEDGAVIEQAIWDEKGYGNLVEAGYADHIAHSRTFGAFDADGRSVGVNRMFNGREGILPPFLDMPFDDEEVRAVLADEAREGLLEELGTVAVVPELRRKGINDHLWRLAYRDAMARGIKHWGIIMEPERVARMNKKYGFTFKQLGPAVPYQGGDCAAFIMSTDEVVQNMQRKAPLAHFWFVRKALHP